MSLWRSFELIIQESSNIMAWHNHLMWLKLKEFPWEMKDARVEDDEIEGPLAQSVKISLAGHSLFAKKRFSAAGVLLRRDRAESAKSFLSTVRWGRWIWLKFWHARYASWHSRALQAAAHLVAEMLWRTQSSLQQIPHRFTSQSRELKNSTAGQSTFSVSLALQMNDQDQIEVKQWRKQWRIHLCGTKLGYETTWSISVIWCAPDTRQLNGRNHGTWLAWSEGHSVGL